MSDGLTVVPPTKLKAEKFIGYSSYGYDDVIATVNGRKVKTYQVAANAIRGMFIKKYQKIKSDGSTAGYDKY